MREVIITCDARSSSTLEWGHKRAEAIAAIASGKKILWHLDFGLFHALKWPLDHMGQFLGFSLAIDHFKNGLWQEFHKFSLGVVLYKGNANPLPQFPWDEKLKTRFSVWLEERACESSDEFAEILFARDVVADYIEQLSLRLMADEIMPYVIFDALPEDLLLRALLTDPDRYEGIRQMPSTWKTEEEKPLAVYMPAITVAQTSLLAPYKKILGELNPEDFKLIPEDQLISVWHGLNTLYFYPPAISRSGQRKVQGFLAAGGEKIELQSI
jgi:hypothetical protein